MSENKGFWNWLFQRKPATAADIRELYPEIIDEVKAEVSAQMTVAGGIIPLGVVSLGYDGEKNLGEMGPIVSHVPEYYRLAARSWQSYMENSISKTIIDKHDDWVIDTGLKLKANPMKQVLASEGIQMSKEDSERHNDVVESRWHIWSNSKHSSFSGENTFHEETKSAYKNANVGGDSLVVLRYIKDTVKVQVIDGMRVSTPFDYVNSNPNTGNIISMGVEVSPTGRHVGYHVRRDGFLNQYDFIPAYSEASSLRTAFLVYGTQWRLGFHRGLPMIATVLESISKIDKYKEATLASAEEMAKITYQVVHQQFSDGTTPLINNMAKAFDADNEGKLPVDVLGEALANKIAVTTGKQAVNNTKGAEIKTLNKGETVSGFSEFHGTNANIICAAIGIPPNVAFSMYTDSFSASRAATKDWDHSMDVKRNAFTNQYYKYVYAFWLYTEILKNKIQAPGYLKAFLEENFMVTESYLNARFTGPHFPHVDPLKEVNAERKKLGTLADHLPLTTVEQATENLGGGDSDSNFEQFSDELSIATGLDIVIPVTEVTNPPE